MNKLPRRLEKAITKLYNSFHNNKLNAFDCRHCAVGNIVGHSRWRMHDAMWVIKGNLPQLFILEFNPPIHKDYSIKELCEVERIFLTQWVSEEKSGHDKETQYKGLCAVIEYLCSLDNVPNVMEIQSLFKYNSKTNKAKKELVLI